MNHESSHLLSYDGKPHWLIASILQRVKQSENCALQLALSVISQSELRRNQEGVIGLQRAGAYALIGQCVGRKCLMDHEESNPGLINQIAEQLTSSICIKAELGFILDIFRAAVFPLSDYCMSVENIVFIDHPMQTFAKYLDEYDDRKIAGVCKREARFKRKVLTYYRAGQAVLNPAEWKTHAFREPDPYLRRLQALSQRHANVV